jgi:desulfoferrodoxin (superoxide reductase-like protein)
MIKQCLIAAGFIMCCVQSASAHPPSKIEVSFDSATKMLVAVIYHPVEDVINHHIGKVDVAINDKEILTQSISRQDNADTQTVRYEIPDIKAGDTLSVEAYCNIVGSREEKIIVK